MIIFEKIDLKLLKEQGKKFNWNRPYCHKCNCYFYGHGYVVRFFNIFTSEIYLKRWRCPNCHTVATVRPDTHWKRFQESTDNIFKALRYRVTNFKWPPWCTRQRGGHWLNKLLSKARLDLLLKENTLETIFFYQNKNLTIS